jgi:hypothetical protein
MTTSPHFFAQDKQLRDARCTEKDAIVRDVIQHLPIHKTFTAVLMPAVHGPEVELLERRGVPVSHMFAIEREPSIREVQARRGLRVPHRAMPADKAVDEVPWERVDFVYLDFLGRPSAPHLETVRKVVRLGLLQPGSCLLVTVGVNRGDGLSCPVVARDGEVRGNEWAPAAVARARGLQPSRVVHHEYTSVAGRNHAARFLTTEIWF